MVSAGGLALRHSIRNHYAFVDYATQLYLALVGLAILLFHNDTIPRWPWLVLAHATALLTVHWLVQANARDCKNKPVDFFRHFYPVFFYIWFYAETGVVNRMFFQTYFDPVLIRCEQVLFGCQPSLVWMLKLPYLAVSEILYAAYFSYYVMIGGVGLALYLRNKQQFFHYVSVVSFVFYICYTIYIVVPVIGPPVFFQKSYGVTLPPELPDLGSQTYYPEVLRRGVFFRLMAWIYEGFEAPGAAIPSSHVAIALCTVSFSFRYLPRIRYFHLFVAILLCLSTVYCRYHYLIDVLAGMATTAILVPIGNWLYFKFERQLAKPKAVEKTKAAGVESS
jgi:membrane-associated phospholipid phosphatase